MNKYCWLILIIITVVSCNTLKKTVKIEQSDKLSDLIDTKISSKKSDYFFCDKIDVKILGEEYRSVKAKVLVSTGKFIFISLSFMGLEIGRAQISEDSIKYINRITKEYFFGNRASMMKLIGMEFKHEEIENLLVKGIPLNSEDTKNRILKKFSDNGNEYIYQYSDEQKRFIKVFFEKTPLKENKIEISDPLKGFYLAMVLNEYRTDPYYPGLIKVSMIYKEKNRNFEISIGKIENSNYQNVSFKINKSYNEMEL